MATQPRVIKTSKRLASMRQLHAAIEHFQASEFECAMTLAAAAEGVLPSTENHYFLKTLKAKLPNFNLIINWLKHGNPPTDTAELSELEVAATIYRGISKFNAVHGAVSPEMAEFLKWAKAHIPKL
jgi:hypothetical protein